MRGTGGRDKRRVDPEPDEVRQAVPALAQRARCLGGRRGGSAGRGRRRRGRGKLAELTSDLQRVHAEYANYRKRVDRDREQIRRLAVGSVLAELLSVLDDIDRAREHDELDGCLQVGRRGARGDRRPSSGWRGTGRPVSRSTRPCTRR